VTGGPGLVVALLCLLIVEPERRRHTGRPDDAPGAIASARALAAVPLYRDTVLGYCAYTFALGGFAYWAPKYLHVRYGMDAGHASVVFGMLTVAGGCLGTLLGGAIADRAVRSRAARRTGQSEGDAAVARGNLLACTIGAAVGAPLAGIAIAATTSTGFFVALLPCEIALFLLSGPINVALLRSAPPALRASAMALSIFAIHALGDLWSPPLIGLVADHAPMQLAMAACPFVFAVAAVVWYRAARTSDGLT
jgi:hypothetical protein